MSEAQLKYARETLASTDARYAVGASTLVDLADARAKYVDAEYNVIKARYNLIAQAVSVEYSKGSMEGMLKIVSGSEG